MDATAPKRETPLEWLAMITLGLLGVALVVRRLGQFSGRHALIAFVHFFAVIITVNLYMASQAIGTFPGLEGRNTYYASQNFDADRRAQQALGWKVTDSYDGGILRLDIIDAASGLPAELGDLEVLVGRPTEAAQDQTPVFIRDGGGWIAPVDLGHGKWLIRIEAHAKDGTRFRQNLQLFVEG